MILPTFDVDLDAVRHNVERWRAHLDGREVWAVVKADAYGVGAARIGRACVGAGAARLVVYDVEEARPLRAAGIEAPIVCLAPGRGDAFTLAVQLDAMPTIEDAAGARELSAYGEWRWRQIPAHVAIDSGTGWTGVPAARAAEFAREVRGLSGIRWEGAWTHFAGIDRMDAQLRAFATAVAALRAEGLEVPALHSASTAPALWGRTTGAVRVGIGLFGSTLGAGDASLGLRTAPRARAHVIAVKRFDAPTPLGYGGQAMAQAGEAIATLRIGYAEGLPRSLSDRGVAVIGGIRCAFAGAVGMQTTMVRVPEGVCVAVGDEAELLGEADGIQLDDVASAASTNPHSVITSLANGMRRQIATNPASSLSSARPL